jgi:hypothetical protein
MSGHGCADSRAFWCKFVQVNTPGCQIYRYVLRLDKCLLIGPLHVVLRPQSCVLTELPHTTEASLNLPCRIIRTWPTLEAVHKSVKQEQVTVEKQPKNVFEQAPYAILV